MKLLIAILLLSGCLYAQAQEAIPTNWKVRSGIYYSAENNWGNLGLSLKSEFSYQFRKTVDVSLLVGAFHSLPELNNEPIFYRNYSSIFTGVSFSHTLVFADVNFIRTSAGLIYTNWNSMSVTENLSSGTIYYRPTRQEGNDLGYSLGLEGGREISEKVAIGFQMSILSYQIFGDIIMLGVNIHMKLK